jgi:hypothetical protein
MSGAASAQQSLEGKFAFNWRADPSREKCVGVAGALLADFKSPAYKCDLKARTNSASGGAFRTCTAAAKNGKEYLIFDTRRACEDERKTQQANGD